MAGFLSLKKKGSSTTDDETIKRRGRSGGSEAGGSDGGSNSGNDGHEGSGGTNTAHGSTASNNRGSSNNVFSGFSTDAVNDSFFNGRDPDAFSAANNPSFGYSNEADFSGGLSGDVEGINTSSPSSGNYGNGGYSLGYSPDFSSQFDSYDKYGGLTMGDSLDSAYDSGLISRPSFMDKTLSFVQENPLAIAGGLLGLGLGGPLAALSLGSLGSKVDTIANPETSALDKTVAVISFTGAPGLMTSAFKGVANLADKYGDKSEAIGPSAPAPTTNANNLNSTRMNLSTAPRVEYKFDPIGQTGGLLNNNLKIDRNQLTNIINSLKKQTPGLLNGLNLNSYRNNLRTGGLSGLS